MIIQLTLAPCCFSIFFIRNVSLNYLCAGIHLIQGGGESKLSTVLARSDAAAIIYFIAQFCVASI